MPHLRNVSTGAVVSVSDETAARLGSEWQPANSPKPKPAKVASAPKSEK